ncbi:hypothetical protein [Streptomyces ossamyceticus]|jgi:hypothetical protein|uniref:hypothetical protein n=1 Tax=Streptomyces ossamyceticus TaxID=249581 RepID=UPI003444DC21
MATATADIAAGLPNLQWRTDARVLTTAHAALLRSLAAEVVNAQTFEDLEAVLGEHAHPTLRQAAYIAARFDETTRRLIRYMPYLGPYPVDAITHLTMLSTQHPPIEYTHGHLRRFALALLDVVDQVGDDVV